MKLLILMILWFPVSLLLILTSLFTLSSLKKQTVAVSVLPHVYAQDLTTVSTPSPTPEITPPKDIRYDALNKFFAGTDSPLKSYVNELISAADRYNLDYALLPAIAMQESGGCKNIPKNSFNCWGFGIYGSKVLNFSNYSEAISQVAKTISSAYIKNGRTNPTLLEDLWTPTSRGQWSYAVNYFMTKIHQLE